MTAAAFKATYSDWKLIKTRSVVQIIFEVPLDQADAAYQVVGGMPDFGSERWFAIAPLTQEVSHGPKLMGLSTAKPAPASDPHPARVTRSWRDMDATQQAAIRCNEVAFQRFLDETYRARWKILSGTDAEKAAELVRVLCKVTSRRDINAYNQFALECWKQLDTEYQNWMRVAV